MMPQLESTSSHRGCGIAKGIQWYLEEKVPGRALAKEVLNVIPSQRKQWGKTFDRTRESSRNHIPVNNKRAVTYQQFVISPDPKDQVSVEGLMEYTKEWAKRFFGDGEAGELGLFEYSIVIHDDNENGVMHAHVVVNNTNLQDGSRLHISTRYNEGHLPNHIQDLGRVRGWHYFDNTKNQKWIEAERSLPVNERRASLPTGSPVIAKEVRAIRKTGGHSWTDEMRALVGVAMNISDTQERFVEACRRLGIEVVFKNDDGVYSKEGVGKISGAKLGAAFRGDSLEEKNTYIKQFSSDDAKVIRENVLSALAASKVVASGDVRLTPKDVALLLSVNRQWKVTTEKGYKDALERCAIRIGKTNGAKQEQYKREYGRIKRAERLSKRCSIFEGVSVGAGPNKRERELIGIANSATDPLERRQAMQELAKAKVSKTIGMEASWPKDETTFVEDAGGSKAYGSDDAPSKDLSHTRNR